MSDKKETVASAKAQEVKKEKTIEELLNEQLKRLERLNSLSADREMLRVTLTQLEEAYNEITELLADPKHKQRFQLQFLKLHDYSRESNKIASIGDTSTILEFVEFLMQKIKVRLLDVEKNFLS